ncbi:hypothetical protein GY45DRAFT_500093 [Cubamyces sp. BRFM 1775]|nr:hypothetical protein GY45DRAFT_500093 [Cubamyces sp. BRFM 1775]
MLRHYYALREAHETVAESRRIWVDTPFSVFTVQSFHPPEGPAILQAMLEHPRGNYGHLPSELRPPHVRPRTSSRASPYPLRNQRSAFSPEKRHSSPIHVLTDAPSKPFAAPAPEHPVLREVQRDANVYQSSPAPALDEIKPFSPIHIELDTSKHGEGAFGLLSRPRVTSSTRRAALGRSKRSTGKCAQDCKENLSASSIIPTINRPRPRGRPRPTVFLAPRRDLLQLLS